MISLNEILNVPMNWQMSFSERSALYYIINKLKQSKKCNICIEIGSYQGGATSVFDKHFSKTYSLDIDHNNIHQKEKYKNTEWVTGQSSETLPKLINKINNSSEVVNFILIDADHSYSSVLSDVNNILTINPKDDIVLLIHDSWYFDSRRAILDSNLCSNQHVTYINTDFCVGDWAGHCYFGGLCLALISPEIRKDELIFEQPHDLMYRSLNRV